MNRKNAECTESICDDRGWSDAAEIGKNAAGRQCAETMEEPLSALRRNFLEGMSRAACTVSVVTTDGPAGRAGVTVSAMASVSAETPSLLVCVHHQSPAASAVLGNGVFCVNLLREDQLAIAETFAGRRSTESGDKFACAEWTRLVTAAPRVIDPLVAFDCRLSESVRVGTHHVIFGEVADIFVAEGKPLVYANREYGATAPLLAP